MQKEPRRPELTEKEKLTPPSPERRLPGVHKNIRVDSAKELADRRMAEVKIQHAKEEVLKARAVENEEELGHNNVIEVVDESQINTTEKRTKKGLLNKLSGLFRKNKEYPEA